MLEGGSGLNPYTMVEENEFTIEFNFINRINVIYILLLFILI
jgi:hypothetical protein